MQLTDRRCTACFARAVLWRIGAGKRTLVLGLILGVACPLGVGGLRWWLASTPQHPYVLFLPCVTVAAALGGARAGGLATIVSAVAAEYAFLSPSVTQLPMVLFVAEAVAITAIFEVFYRTRDRLRDALAELAQRSRAELDAKEAQRKTVESALRSTEEQLRHAQKMEAIGRLAGGVAHDFNNVLSVIISYVELAAEELPRDSSVRADLAEVQAAAQRAAGMTRTLLAFSRHQVSETRAVDVNDVIESTTKMTSRVLREDVEVVSKLARDAMRVECDPEELGRVIMNLLVNARDAMPDGGRITIETANVVLDGAYAFNHLGVEAGPHVLIAVSDTGTGMDAETQARIFEPFFTTKAPGKGTGLGLSTVYGIVKRAGGTIWVYSEPGHGTTFKIYLPQAEAAETSRPRPALAARGGSEKILVVEDEPQLRAVATRILQRGGYTVISCANGEEAVEAARREQALDLVFTDVVMPKMGGRELRDRIAAIHPNLPVLFASGYTDDAAVSRGLTALGVPFMQKPITPDGLLRKVREVLDDRTARRT